MTCQRILDKLLRMGMPGPEASIIKLHWTEITQAMPLLGMKILGPRVAALRHARAARAARRPEPVAAAELPREPRRQHRVGNQRDHARHHRDAGARPAPRLIPRPSARAAVMAEGTKKSLLRRLRLPLLLLVALAALLALLPQLLLPWVERSATDALHTPVAVGWIGVDDLALGKVGVRSVGVGGDDGLTIERISVRPDLQQLLRGKIVLERIEIDGLRGTVEQDATGRPALRGLPFPDGGTGASGPAVTVQEIQVSAADVTVIPPTGLRRQPIAVRIDELLLRQVPTADAGPAYQGELRGTLDGVPLTAEARSDQTADGTRIAAEAALRGAPVSSEQLRAAARLRVAQRHRGRPPELRPRPGAQARSAHGRRHARRRRSSPARRRRRSPPTRSTSPAWSSISAPARSISGASP